MSKLTTFICDQCKTIADDDNKHGWITLYTAIDPNKVGQKAKNMTLHLCPTCARKAIFTLWNNPLETIEKNKKILKEATRNESKS